MVTLQALTQFSVEDMNQYRGRLGVGWQTCVVAGMLTVGFCNQKNAGVFVALHNNALFLVVIYHLVVPVPKHVGGALGGVVEDTHQTQDTAGLHVLLGGSQDLRFCFCWRKEQNVASVDLVYLLMDHPKRNKDWRKYQM